MLTDLQTKKLTRYFQVYDIDDDGAIEASDFERIVENGVVVEIAGCVGAVIAIRRIR